MKSTVEADTVSYDIYVATM